MVTHLRNITIHGHIDNLMWRTFQVLYYKPIKPIYIIKYNAIHVWTSFTVALKIICLRQINEVLWHLMNSVSCSVSWAQLTCPIADREETHGLSCNRCRSLVMEVRNGQDYFKWCIHLFESDCSVSSPAWFPVKSNNTYSEMMDHHASERSKMDCPS